MKASYKKHILKFKRPAGTSRGVMTDKETWIITLEDNNKVGYGECSPLKGLSIDDREDYEDVVAWVVENIELGKDILLTKLKEFPSIQFGIETAFASVQGDNPDVLFPSEFTNTQASIPINGLIWMGDEVYMKEQIEEKLAKNFNCIKLKIGAIDFDKELKLLGFIRKNFSPETIEIRVDANGAFSADTALSKLQTLSEFSLHSIEQPIAPKQIKAMCELCRNTPLPIALDEELIGLSTEIEKDYLLRMIKPQYIILKPSLIGGFNGTDQWIAAAEKYKIGWWITSALESNIGLNAIAQYTYLKNNKMHQGLGTGALYENNFPSNLKVENGHLSFYLK